MIVKFGIALFLIFIGAAGFFLFWNRSVDSPDGFDVSAAQIAKDLEGTSVGLLYGQVWPFDPTQNIHVTVLSRKLAKEYVVVAVDVTATATIEKLPDPAKAQKKEPGQGKTAALSGVAKLHYEKLGDRWYLIQAEGVSLKASAAD